jgi:hypothetical protein
VVERAGHLALAAGQAQAAIDCDGTGSLQAGYRSRFYRSSHV